MGRIAKPKKLNITVSELKRRLAPQSNICLIEFNKEEMVRVFMVEKATNAYFSLKELSKEADKPQMIKWPKKKHLTATIDGFIIDTKYSVLRFRWE